MWADCLQLGDDLAGAADVLAPLLGDEPGNAAAQHRLGMVRAELGDFDAAIAHMVRAVALDPEPALGWANLGMLLKVQGRFEESLDTYGEALLRPPRDARIRVNRVVALLRAGLFAEAWRDHAWRLALAECPGLPRARLLPALATLAELAGRTVLLTHEGGFGDTLQFCRYIPLLAARGARIGLAIPWVLHRLLEGLPGVVAVVEPDGEPPAYDWHCPMTSLPEVFGTVLSTIPAETPCITADPGLVGTWAARLPGGPGCRVGLVWAGQARPGVPGFATVNGRRNMTLAEFAPLGAIEGVRFISVQAGPRGVRGARAAARSGAVRPDAVGCRLRRHCRNHCQSRPCHQRRYVGGPSSRRARQAGVPAGSLRQLLALVERANGQSLVSEATHLPPGADWRVGAHRTAGGRGPGGIRRLHALIRCAGTPPAARLPQRSDRRSPPPVRPLRAARHRCHPDRPAIDRFRARSASACRPAARSAPP
jgi:hypothetical protein